MIVTSSVNIGWFMWLAKSEVVLLAPRKETIQVHHRPHPYFSPEGRGHKCFHPLTSWEIISGEQSRQTKGTQPLARTPSGTSPFRAPEQPGQAALGRGPGVSSNAEICDLFRSELGAKGRDLQEWDSNLDQIVALHVQRRLKNKKLWIKKS